MTVSSLSSPRPELSSAREALVEARRYRAEHLIAVAEGTLTPLDVIEAAATEEGKPLRRISLRQLLLSQPGWGKARTERILSALRDRIDPTQDNPTVSWLLDPRSGGRRMLVWLDLQGRTTTTTTPWSGFPFRAKPDGPTRGGAQ